MDCKIDHTFLPLSVTHCPECDEMLKDAPSDENYGESDCSDVECDSFVMSSAGMGTDEDYGYYGGDEEN